MSEEGGRRIKAITCIHRHTYARPLPSHPPEVHAGDVFARRGEAAGEVELLLREERLVLNGSCRALSPLRRGALPSPSTACRRRRRRGRAGRGAGGCLRQAAPSSCDEEGWKKGMKGGPWPQRKGRCCSPYPGWRCLRRLLLLLLLLQRASLSPLSGRRPAERGKKRGSARRPRGAVPFPPLLAGPSLCA